MHERASLVPYPRSARVLRHAEAATCASGRDERTAARIAAGGAGSGPCRCRATVTNAVNEGRRSDQTFDRVLLSAQGSNPSLEDEIVGTTSPPEAISKLYLPDRVGRLPNEIHCATACAKPGLKPADCLSACLRIPESVRKLQSGGATMVPQNPYALIRKSLAPGAERPRVTR
jgi:hypothetical protein